MKTQSVVSLDPIERSRKKQDGLISRFFKTRHFGGKAASFPDPFGHYLFVGKQRMGKTASMVWYFDFLAKRYKKKGKKVGKIGYTSDLKSLPLVQYGKTHKIVDHNKVKIVNVGTVKVQGLEQFI